MNINRSNGNSMMPMATKTTFYKSMLKMIEQGKAEGYLDEISDAQVEAIKAETERMNNMMKRQMEAEYMTKYKPGNPGK